MAKVIAIQCAHCGRALKVTGDFAGKRVKCPGCAQPISVPGATTAALPSAKPKQPSASASRPKTSKPADVQTRIPATASVESQSSKSQSAATTTPPARRKHKRPVRQKEVLDEVEFLDDDEDAYEDYGDVETADDDFGNDWDDDDFGDNWDDHSRTSRRRTGGKSRGGRASARRGGRKKGRQKQDNGWPGTNSGVLGGIAIIVVAVVWFFGGLAAGIIFFYPPILLIIGIIAVIRGMMA